jgi:hypothetical protein
MKLKQYCKVKLKNGKTASIVEIFQKDGEDDEYIADLDVERFMWETVTIHPNDIEEVIRE